MDRKNMKRDPKMLGAILTLVIVWLMSPLIGLSDDNGNNTEVIPYNELVKLLNEGSIEKVTVKDELGNIAVTMKDGTEKMSEVPDSNEFIEFMAHSIEDGSDVKIEVIKKFNGEPIFTLFIMLIPLIFLNSFMRRTVGGGKFEISSTKAKETFDDIAGIEEVKEQLLDIIEYLENPKKYSSSGARMPKGVLLSGEPGNGKTLLAKAMSREAGVEFFQVTASMFDEKFVGVGASRVRKLFNEARRKAPAIVFIDEIDSLGKKRYSEHSNDQTLNQLLAEMDGFGSNENVVVIAATNHQEVIDKALLRPGRFDRIVYIPNPDVKSRQLILELHARNKKISNEVSLEAIARRTIGFSGANLENILNEAAIYSVKTGRDEITNEAIDEAIARVIVGLKKKHSVMSLEEKHLTAIHESGHAVVSFIERPEVQNFCISIVPRGKSGGYNLFDASNKLYQQKKDLFKQMKVLYAGRAAEEIILGDISNGASNDLEKNAQIALEMITKYGMANALTVKVRGAQSYNKEVEISAKEESESICKETYEKTKLIIKQYRYQIEKLASILEEKEFLSQEEVEEFMSKNFKF